MRGMTSYSRAQRKGVGFHLEVTLRSTNSKYLEIYTHQLPPEKIFLEEIIKKEIKQKISRGRIEVYFVIQSHPKQHAVFDSGLLTQYHREIKAASRSLNVPQEKLAGNLLSLPGVICVRQEKSVKDSVILSALKEGLGKLGKFKSKEGALIKKEIIKNLQKIKQNITAAKNATAHLVGNKENGKDIAEEIALISFYIKKLDKLIASKNSVSKGKSIDFLTQEILRELNAATSKTKIQKICWSLVETKSYLERIREQAQNIE